MTKKRASRITPTQVDQDALENALRIGGNPISPAVAGVIRVVTPILARLAVRYLARKYRKSVTEGQVNATGKYIGVITNRIVDRYT